MAQTKLRKQIKALKAWEKRAETLPLRTFDRDNPIYISNQIVILTNKIVETSHYKKDFCALCGFSFVQWDGNFNICPFCRGTFHGVTIKVTKLADAFQEVGDIFKEANQPLQRIIL